MFTCISCKVAFETADEQRSHFATDWHRYNMKRRVADLPPLPAASFNEKVLERREQNAIRTDPRSLTCTACSKAFATENAFRSHVQSKRHRDREAYLAKRAHTDAKEPADDSNKGQVDEGDSEEDEADDKTDDGTEDEEDIEARLATYRRRIRPSDCLFCPTRTASPEDAVAHMSRSHGFFIPDRDHLLDLPGLLSYLGEKIIIGNLCLFCPNGGKEFGSVDAVRRHMTDKGHCKMAYESNEDRAEVVDFYDHEVIDEEWEDMEDAEGDVEGDVIDMPGEVSLAADGLSLVLPSGRILGHRSLKLYYDQNFRPIADRKPVDDKVKRVREKLADPTQALVPVAGGSGGFGRGLQVMKARNAGEAKWAKKQGRSFTEQRRRTDHATRVGFVHNNQKHFRDPLCE